MLASTADKCEESQYDHDNTADKADEDAINASITKSKLTPDAQPFVFNGNIKVSRNSEAKESKGKPTEDQFNKKTLSENASDAISKLKADAKPFTLNIRSSKEMLVDDTNVLDKACEDWTTKHPPKSVTTKLTTDAKPFVFNSTTADTKTCTQTNKYITKSLDDARKQNPILIDKAKATSSTAVPATFHQQAKSSLHYHVTQTVHNFDPNAPLQATTPYRNPYQQATQSNFGQRTPISLGNSPGQSPPQAGNISPPNFNLAMTYAMHGHGYMAHELNSGSQLVAMPGVPIDYGGPVNSDSGMFAHYLPQASPGYALPTIVRQPANY